MALKLASEVPMHIEDRHLDCSVCGRCNLPADAFSKRQQAKTMEAMQRPQNTDRRVSGQEWFVCPERVCKSCLSERESKQQAEAASQRGGKGAQEVATDGAEERQQVDTPSQEHVVASFLERPFGMTPVKIHDSAYIVLKVSEGKTAAITGIRPGWRIVAVSEKPCDGLDLEGVQSLLKSADLPVLVEFAPVPISKDFCTSCQKLLAVDAFSRKMRTKTPDKRRCTSCTDC